MFDWVLNTPLGRKSCFSFYSENLFLKKILNDNGKSVIIHIKIVNLAGDYVRALKYKWPKGSFCLCHGFAKNGKKLQKIVKNLSMKVTRRKIIKLNGL